MICKDCNCCRDGAKPYSYICVGVKEPFEIIDIRKKCTEYSDEYWKKKLEESVTYKKVSLEEMLSREVNDILDSYKNGGTVWYWRNGEGDFLEIIEIDLLRGRFVTEDGDFSEFEWELKESNIYVKQG